MKKADDLYKPCSHIKRDQPDNTVDQELLNKIATEYRTLPSFENTSFEQKLMKYYSLERNELLACRWETYKDSISSRTFGPFQFPESRDWHFYNATVKRMPSMTVTRWKDLRKKMRAGPGVDTKGQMFIPYEMFMVRGEAVKEDVAERKRKLKREKLKKEALENLQRIKEAAKEIRKRAMEARQADRKALNKMRF